VLDPHLLHGPANVIQVLLEAEFRRMHADHHEPLSLYFSAQARTYGAVRSQLMQV
jgi:hypothetical protein